MPNILSERDLVAELQKQTAGFGLTVREDGQHGLSGQAEKIRAKWWLGGRKVDYRMSCRLTVKCVGLLATQFGRRLNVSSGSFSAVVSPITRCPLSS